MPLVASAEGEQKKDQTSHQDQGQMKQGAEKSAKITRDEKQVLSNYHQLNQMEIALGKLALQKASRDDVKEYAQQIVDNHEATQDKLMAFAKDHDVTMPKADKQAMQQQQDATKKLDKLQGAAFDREFLQMMEQQQQKAVDNIDANIAKVDNQQLADLLRQTKPVLQQHAERARELMKNQPQARADEGMEENQPKQSTEY